jgi:hypothetical protein
MDAMMNPALEAQAIGRSWRMGQLRPVTVYHLFMKDRRVLRLRLSGLLAVCASRSNVTLPSLTLDDIRFAFGSVEQRIMELVAQRAAGGGGQEGSSAMDKLREAKGKAKLLVSEVRP